MFSADEKIPAIALRSPEALEESGVYPTVMYNASL